MKDINRFALIKKLILFIGITVTIYLTFRFLLPLTIPFILAGIVSTFYYPFLQKTFSSRKIWHTKKRYHFLFFTVLFFYISLFLFLLLISKFFFKEGESIILNFPFYQAKTILFIETCCKKIDIFLHYEQGFSFQKLESFIHDIDFKQITGYLPKLTCYSMHIAKNTIHFIFSFFIVIIATFFMMEDYERIKQKILKSPFHHLFNNIIAKCKDTFFIYLKAQGFIMVMDGILCTLGYLLIQHPYPFVLGIITAIIDALPIMGAGFILIPYIFIFCLRGNFLKVLVLFLIYLGCIFIRQMTEPKMIGKKIGLHPLLTIFNMYIGVQLFGLFGFILGPIGFLIGYEIYHEILYYERNL